MRKGLQLMLQTMLLGTTDYLILVIFQQMSNVRLIGFVNFYCKSLSIKIALTSFKVADVFNMKDSIPKSLKSLPFVNKD